MQPSKSNQEETSSGFLPFLLQGINTSPPPTNSIPTHKISASAVAPKKFTEQPVKAGGSPQTAHGSQRIILQPTGEGQGREGSQLTAQQRRVVGDISRLFSSQASRPTKLLIRLNQTQVGTKGEGTLAQSKLQRIQITRLDEQAEREIREGQVPTELGSQGELMWRGSNEELLSSASSIKIPLSECSNVRHVEPHPSRSKDFNISRQVSMMYVAELNMSTLLGMRNPPQLFSRFNRKQEDKLDSIGSNFSEDFIVKKEEGLHYVKLLEIDLFLKRKEVQQHRSEELRQANERMLATHLADKENVDVLRNHIKQLEEKYEKLLEELRKQAEGLKSANTQLQAQVQNKDKAINSVKQLNEQYVKENNQLKAKIKDHLKTIHHLKADLSAYHDKPTDAPVAQQPPLSVTTQNAQAQNAQNAYPITDRKFPGPKLLLQQRSAINDCGKPSIPRSPRKEVTFNQLYQEPALNSQFYEASPYYELTERPLPIYSKADKQREARLANCRSQGLLIHPQPQQPQSERQRVQPTSRSQKAIGIRRNNLHTEPPISPSTRNLVRVGKPGNTDGSILLGQKLRDNKSLSSYSNLSGKSLSQRVGFISKPAQPERTKGLLVDYMAQPILQEKMEERPKESQQRLQFRNGEQ